MAEYSNTSPYYATPQNKINLEQMVARTITAEADDQTYTIERTYAYRPDLLAYDYYGTPKLWWVFAQRNMDVLKDPVYDLVAGAKIYLPRADSLQKYLGY